MDSDEFKWRNEELIKMLKRHEGVRRHAYRCTAGHLTVGVGRNIDEAGGLGLSADEIDYLLKNDVLRVEAELRRTFVWFKALNPARADALMDFVFNVGLPKALQFKKMIAALEKSAWQAAADELLDSKYAAQVGDRARELADMIKTGRYTQ